MAENQNNEQYTNPMFNQNIDYVGIEKESSQGIGDGVFNTLSIGFDNKCIKGDKRGLWVGHKEFAKAPFKVDMNGQIVTYGLENVGGVMRYNKLTFIDTANAGYYIGPEGIFMSNAGATKSFKYDQSTGLVSIVGTINATDGSIGGFTITSTKLYANGGVIASDNNTYPAAKLDANGVTINGTGSSAFNIVDGSGVSHFYMFGAGTQGISMYSNGNITLQFGAGGGFSFQPQFTNVDYLGGSGKAWAGLYLKSTTGNQNGPTGVGGGGGTSGDADGTVGIHSHSLPNHSHTINFNYIELTINGLNYKLLTA